MKYPYASEGVKHLYHAVVCELVVLGLALLVGIVSILVASGAEGLAVLIVLLGIAILILAVAVLVLEIIGSNKASKDEHSFLLSFYCLIGVLVITIVNYFVGNSIVSTILSLIGNLGTLLFTFFVFMGLIKLFTNLSNQQMADKSKKTMFIFMALYALFIILDLVSGFFSSEDQATVQNLLSMLATISSVVAEVLLLLLLKESYAVLSVAKDEPRPLDEPKLEESNKETDASDKELDLEEEPVEEKPEEQKPE